MPTWFIGGEVERCGVGSGKKTTCATCRKQQTVSCSLAPKILDKTSLAAIQLSGLKVWLERAVGVCLV